MYNDRTNSSSRYRHGWAILLYIFAISILLWVLELSFGWDVYGIRQGSGQQAVEQVRIVKAKKRKKLVLNPKAAIIWTPADDEEVLRLFYKDRPHDDIPVGEEYKGGWPAGMETGKVQFVRLNHSGKGRYQQMEANANFLNAFHKMTGLKIDPRPKLRTVSDLGKYRKGFEPPFLFMTGTGEIGLSGAEKKALREYTLKSIGMLFVDNGGGSFDQAFRRLMREMYPEYQLVVIPKDDPIFKFPFLFPHGAPRLFHYNNDTLGVRGPGGRWLVFYHPGGLHRAWQTGRTGMRKSVVKKAYKLGINVVAYSFHYYMAARGGKREVPPPRRLGSDGITGRRLGAR